MNSGRSEASKHVKLTLSGERTGAQRLVVRDNDRDPSMKALQRRGLLITGLH